MNDCVLQHVAVSEASSAHLLPDPARIIERRLQPSDIDELKQLHADWFPIQYEEYFFKDTVEGRHSLAICLVDPDAPPGNCILGVAVCDMHYEHRCEESFLPPSNHPDRQILYILTFGVRASCRRLQLGTRLMTTILQSVVSNPACHGVYLHVLSTNTPALSFYRKSGFIQTKFLPEYYDIQGEKRDSFLYFHPFYRPEPPTPPLVVMMQSIRRWFSKQFKIVSSLLFSEPYPVQSIPRQLENGPNGNGNQPTQLGM